MDYKLEAEVEIIARRVQGSDALMGGPCACLPQALCTALLARYFVHAAYNGYLSTCSRIRKLRLGLSLKIR